MTKLNTSTDAPSKQSKKDRLIKMLRMPHGVSIQKISEELGWQSHTVRAALSGLRTAGFEISVDRTKKDGVARYKIVSQTEVEPRDGA